MANKVFILKGGNLRTITDQRKEKKIHEILETIKPLLFICQLFGAAPLTINLREKILSIIPQLLRPSHKLLEALHWLWCITLAGSVLTATHFQRILFDGSLPFMTRTIYSLEYPAATSSFLMIVFGGQYFRHIYSDVIERLADLDVKLDTIGIRTDYRRVRKRIWMVLVLYFIFFTSILVIDFGYNEWAWIDFLRSSTTYSLPNITWVLALTQFSLVMVLVQCKLGKMNYLLELFRDEMDLDRPNHPVLMKILRRYEKDRRLNCSDETLSARAVTTEKLRHMYIEALAIGKLVTKSYSFLLCTTIFAGFVAVLIQFFQLYRYSENSDEYNIYLHLYTILWIILFGGRIVMILYAGHVVSQEKAKTGPILLYELESNKCSKADPNLHSVINKFSMQMMHEETHMTVSGILKLKLSLINPILHALATYLVILIQFDAAQNSTNGKVSVNDDKISISQGISNKISDVNKSSYH